MISTELFLWIALVILTTSLIIYLIYIKKQNKKKKEELKKRVDGDERFSKVSIHERSKTTKRFSNK